MDLFIGIGMLLFFAYNIGNYFFNNNLEPDLKFYAQLGISGAGSFYLLLVKNFSGLKQMLSKFRNKNMDQKQENVGTEKSVEDKEYMDYQALVYLKKRAEELKSKEALDLVIKLNTLLFSGGKSTQ